MSFERTIHVAIDTITHWYYINNQYSYEYVLICILFVFNSCLTILNVKFFNSMETLLLMRVIWFFENFKKCHLFNQALPNCKLDKSILKQTIQQSLNISLCSFKHWQVTKVSLPSERACRQAMLYLHGFWWNVCLVECSIHCLCL